MRPSGWHVLDMGEDPTPGDPYRVRVLARSAGRMADDAADAYSAVRSLASDGAVLSWVGLAGEVFRGAIDDFPRQLGKLQDSYEQASEALEFWAARLDDVQSTADRALEQGKQAQAEIDALSASLATARAQTSSAAAASDRLSDQPAGGLPPSPEQLRAATRNLDAAQDRVGSLSSSLSGAQSRLSAAKRMAEQARDLRRSTARTVKDRLYDASDAGIQPKSRWEKFKEAAKRAWDITVKIATVVVAVLSVLALVMGGPLVWGILFALSAVLLADSLAKYARGEGSMWEIGLNMLGVIPGGRLLGAAGKLLGRSATGARALASTARGLATGRRALGGMTGALRGGLGRTVGRLPGQAGRLRALDEDRLARDFPEFAAKGLPSRNAREFQTGDLYPGQDAWVDRVRLPGDRFYVGAPGHGLFVVPESELSRVGSSARRMYEGVQVNPRSVDGVPTYRGGGLDGFEVLKPFPSADSTALANRQFGDGGLEQTFLPTKINRLIEGGYIKPIGNHPLPDELIGRIPEGGRRLVPTAEGP